MQDRIAEFPNRIKLTPVSGQTNVYDLERADSPIQEGTRLCKGTLLSDDTAELLGLLNNPTVDDALKELSGDSQIVTGSYIGTDTFSVATAQSTGKTPSCRFRKLNGYLFAFGYNQLWYTEDGVNWLSGNAPSANIYDMAYGNGVYVCVCGTQIYWATTLGTWTLATSNNNFCYRNVAFNGNKFLCTTLSNYLTASNVYCVSTDGKTWVQNSSNVSLLHRSLEYQNGYFYSAIGNKIYRSTDGASWTIVYTTRNGNESLTMSDRVLFTVGYSGGAYSENGQNWIEYSCRNGQEYYVHSVAKSDGYYYIIASDGNNYVVYKTSSLTDTSSWEVVFTESLGSAVAPKLIEVMGNTIVVGCRLRADSNDNIYTKYILPPEVTEIVTDIKPQFIIIYGGDGVNQQYLFIASASTNKAWFIGTFSSSSSVSVSANIKLFETTVEFDDNKITIKGQNAELQMNRAAYNYNYTVIGKR